MLDKTKIIIQSLSLIHCHQASHHLRGAVGGGGRDQHQRSPAHGHGHPRRGEGQRDAEGEPGESQELIEYFVMIE